MARRPTAKVEHLPIAPLTSPKGETSQPAKIEYKPSVATPILKTEPINPLAGTGQRPNPPVGSYKTSGKKGWIGPGY